MTFVAPKYPQTLTNKNWQKNKGLLAKAAGETGMGKVLDSAEKAYEAVDWSKLDIRQNIPGFAKDWKQSDIDKSFETAKKQGAAVKALYVAVRAIEDKAKQVAVAFSKNKQIPSSSVKVVEEVGKAAHVFSFAIAEGTISDMITAEKKLMEKDVQDKRLFMANLASQIRKNVDDFPSEVGGVTMDNYPQFWSQNIRAVGTVLPVLAKDNAILDPEWKIWKQFSNKLETPKSEEELKKQLVILTKVSQSLKPKLAQI